MSRKGAFLIIIASFVFSTYAEQSFVVPFDQQCREGIWNGRAVRKISSIEKYFENLQDIQ